MSPALALARRFSAGVLVVYVALLGLLLFSHRCPEGPVEGRHGHLSGVHETLGRYHPGAEPDLHCPVCALQRVTASPRLTLAPSVDGPVASETAPGLPSLAPPTGVLPAVPARGPPTA